MPKIDLSNLLSARVTLRFRRQDGSSFTEILHLATDETRLVVTQHQVVYLRSRLTTQPLLIADGKDEAPESKSSNESLEDFLSGVEKELEKI